MPTGKERYSVITNHFLSCFNVLLLFLSWMIAYEWLLISRVGKNRWNLYLYIFLHTNQKEVWIVDWIRIHIIGLRNWRINIYVIPQALWVEWVFRHRWQSLRPTLSHTHTEGRGEKFTCKFWWQKGSCYG